MKLGTKIASGFAAILVILTAMGTVSILKMNQLKKEAVHLAEESIPLADGAAEVEMALREAAFEMRDYGYTGNADKLSITREQLKKSIAAADTLTRLAQGREALKEKATGFAEQKAKIEEYASSVEDTVKVMDAKSKALSEIEESYGSMTNAFATMLQAQEKTLVEEIDGAADDAAIHSRFHKIQAINAMSAQAAESMVAVQRGLATRQQKDFEASRKNLEQIVQGIKDLEATLVREADRENLAKVRAEVDKFASSSDAVEEAMADAAKQGTVRLAIYTPTVAQASEVTNQGFESARTIGASTAATLTNFSRLNLLGLIISVAVGAVLALVITRGITRQITRVIENLSRGGEQIASASHQVAQSSQQMAEGASEQASSLEEISSSLEEMASMTKQNAENASQANSTASETRSAAEKGSNSMQRMVEAIDRIKSSSDETAKIIKTIDEIAFQTNLLALNAAVEAARAGEAGKGFAVVAEEVRNLAQRSAQAAKTTSELIEGSQHNAEHGVAVSNEVAEVLRQIVGSVQKVTQLVAEVTAASREQATGIDQVNLAVAQLDKVTQANAANAEESASASEELSAQSRELNEMVDVLVGIVGGSASRSMNLSKSIPMIAAATAGRPALRAPGASPTRSCRPSKSPTTSSPGDVIPLGEEDMQEF